MHKESIKTITIVVLLFIIWILSTCNGNTCPKVKSAGVNVVHRSDTIYVFQDREIKVPVYINNPTIVYDTISEIGDSIRIYNNPYEDSLIGGSIYSKTIGQLVSQNFTYKLKKPITTTIYDSVRITETIVIDSTEKPKTQLGIGLSVTYPYTMISPNIFIKSKNNSIFGLGYDVVNKNYSVQFIKILKFKK